MMLATTLRWFSVCSLCAVVAACLPGTMQRLAAATIPSDSEATARGTGVVQRIDDYAAATAAARDSAAMLLVSIEPQAGDPTDAAGSRLEQPDVQERFAGGGTPWIFCRLALHDAASFMGDPGLVEMRGGPGLFVVDHAHDAWRGRIVSILPRTPGKYYRFAPDHIDELATLPAASLTQRSLILAVRIHPEHPRSTEGACDPALCQEAEAHSAHQARIRRQGHHGWDNRARRIGGAAAEVCAESWEHQDLLDSCVDCVASWRQSAGHWRAVSGSHSAYGYDIRRGSNGIWYATGIFR
jgi:hypothetical protein